MTSPHPSASVPVPRVVAVEPREGYRLWLTFENGAAGFLDMTKDVKADRGPKKALRDMDLFRSVYVNSEEEDGLIWPLPVGNFPYYGPWAHGPLYYRVVLNAGQPTDKTIPAYEVERLVGEELTSRTRSAAVG